MAKRLLEVLPSEMITLSREELLDGIRAAEGRTVCAYVCPRAAPYVENVSNIELVTAFGADLINIEGFDPRNPQMPGLPSKDAAMDAAQRRDLQAPMGLGWNTKDWKNLVKRPLGTFLMATDFPGQFDGSLMDGQEYCDELLEYVIEQGYQFVCISGMSAKSTLAAVENAARVSRGRIMIEAGIPHGPGSIKGDWPPYDLKKLVNPKFVSELVKAGADLIDLPAVGVVPGYTIDYVASLADAVHEAGGLVASCIAHSLEAADEYTISRIAIDNKVAGADMFNIAAGGVYEAVTLPEALQAFCIAIKGKRHTYRRMGQSPMR